jgi:alternate signal-mediated exported protein
MNKNVKGGIALGAGLLLLIGGGGTFALWNATSEADAGTINTGHLTAAAFTGSWEDASGATFTPGTDFAVPGDELTYTATSAVSAEGTNLLFTAFIDDADIEAALAAGWVLDDFSVDVTGANFTAGSAELGADYFPTSLPTNIDVFGLTSAAATGSIELSFTIIFGDSVDADVDNPTHDNSSVLDDLSVTIQQVFAS